MMTSTHTQPFNVWFWLQFPHLCERCAYIFLRPLNGFALFYFYLEFTFKSFFRCVLKNVKWLAKINITLIVTVLFFFIGTYLQYSIVGSCYMYQKPILIFHPPFPHPHPAPTLSPLPFAKNLFSLSFALHFFPCPLLLAHLMFEVSKVKV